MLMELVPGFGLEDDYMLTVRDIQLNFEDNLKRLCYVDRSGLDDFVPREFYPVGMNNSTDTFYMENVKLNTPVEMIHPDIRVDLLNEYVKCTFDVNDMFVSADYYMVPHGIYDETLINKGKLNIIISAFRVDAILGMFTRQDSFMPLNYDITYHVKEFKCMATNLQPSEQAGEEPIFELISYTDDVVHNSIVSVIWNDLQKSINSQVENIITGNVVNFSLSEMFLDEPQIFKEYERIRMPVACEIFTDNLLSLVDVMEAAGDVADASPSLRATFVLDDDVYLFEATSCRLEGFPTLMRVGDVSAYFTEITQAVFAHVQLQNFCFVFDGLMVKCMTSPNRTIRGRITVKPERHSVMLKFHRPKNHEDKIPTARASFNMLFMENIGMTSVTVPEQDKKHPRFENLLDHLLPFMVGHVRHQFSDMLYAYCKQFDSLGRLMY